MSDFLCGCSYCVTVDRGFPLDIANHMIRCHSWRKGMVKAIELMNQTPVPEIVVKKREDINPKEVEYNDVSPCIDYSWVETDLYGWSYIAPGQELFHRDEWVYLEDLKWVWLIAELEGYLYSYEYGWLYNTIYQRQRVIYWYDRRIWILSSSLE